MKSAQSQKKIPSESQEPSEIIRFTTPSNNLEQPRHAKAPSDFSIVSSKHEQEQIPALDANVQQMSQIISNLTSQIEKYESLIKDH